MLVVQFLCFTVVYSKVAAEGPTDAAESASCTSDLHEGSSLGTTQLSCSFKLVRATSVPYFFTHSGTCTPKLLLVAATVSMFIVIFYSVPSVVTYELIPPPSARATVFDVVLRPSLHL